MSRFRDLTTSAALAAAALLPVAAAAQTFNLGRPALPEETAAWDVKIMPDGRGLPEGQGSVADGEGLFSDRCAMCHGEFAEGSGRFPALAGGEGSLANDDPVKTVGSFWPYLSTVFDYAHRSMPYGDAQSLTADETYAVTAYILYSNDLVDEDFVLTKANFLDVKLPNADNFITDDRDAKEVATFSAEPCMAECKPKVEITRRAANLDVTPGEPDDGAAGAVLLDGGATSTEPAADEPAPPAPSGAEPAPALKGDSADAAAAPAAAGNVPTAAAPDVDAAPAPAAPAADAAPAPVEAAAAPAADDPAMIAAGEKVFGKCKACHKVGEDATNGVGPVLNGVVGRTAGQVEGYKYSKAMADAGAGGLVWDSAALHQYLANPKAHVPGTKMSFAGLKKPADVDAVVAYLAAHP